MRRPISQALPLRMNRLALLVAAALMPGMVWSLDLTQSPPGSVQPYVRPNVIISIDDSGSMNWRTIGSNWAGTNELTPPWKDSTKRINILKYALGGHGGTGGVFRDTTLLPDGKIRLAWQVMWNNGNSPGAGGYWSGARSVDSGSNTLHVEANTMQVLDSDHRQRFLDFVSKLTPSGGTPSHRMFKQADTYMRRPLQKNGPWAAEPGVKGAPYLACRRNYHIMMTDGRWNNGRTGIPDSAYRDNATNLTLPDGTVYGGTTNDQRKKTALYRDTETKTLADWAFYSWAKPLQTSGLTGDLKPTSDYNKAPAEKNFGPDSKGNDAILERYWDPRYNPATWSHMVTYTIGFSNDAITWPGASDIKAPEEKVPFGPDSSFPPEKIPDLGSFQDLVTGNKTWPNMGHENRRALDLWHAALNSRGSFYAVNTGEDLQKAFSEIIGKINEATDPDTGSSATSGSNVQRYDVSRYVSVYEPDKNWKGLIKSELVQTDGTIIANPGWGGKTTADKLDALLNADGRLILSWNDKLDTSGDEQGGTTFRWTTGEDNLSNAQKQWLRRAPTIAGAEEAEARGQLRLDYIRGSHSHEGKDPGDFRPRQSRQGDSINSVVWYTGPPSATYALKDYSSFVRDFKARTPMIYVGSNDGMLHGFSAADGTEKIAYVPKGVIPNLRFLTGPDYDTNHRMFVDGSPMTGDVDTGESSGTDWRTLLVGTLGAGGKGYFVLDVTNPDESFSDANAGQLVVLDRTRNVLEAAPDCITDLNPAQQAACNQMVEENADIGHITARPVIDDTDPMRSTQFTRMNNDRWAVVLGNGYNSTNQRPVLLVQYLDGDRELVRIAATQDTPGNGNAYDNGLASPRLVDINGDGRTDVVYAGDNLGNLWKFDLTDPEDGKWKVAFNDQPLLTARGPASYGSAGARNKIQPITAAPTVRANDRMMLLDPDDPNSITTVGGLMVVFGTGRNVAENDPESIDVHSLYSVLDSTRYCIVTPEGGGASHLSVHPGGTTDCDGGSTSYEVPAPTPLGTGVTAAQLAQQKITEVDAGEFGTVDHVSELNTESWASHNGWYLDFPAVGERLLKPMEFFDGSNILAVYSQVPAKGKDVDPTVESCDWSEVDEERQWLTLLNIMDGKRPTVQLVDYDGNATYDTNDLGVSRLKIGKGSHNLITTATHIIDIDTKNKQELLARMPEESMRPSWRQLR